MVGLKDHKGQFKDTYLSEDHSHMSVNDMWVKFKTGFVDNYAIFFLTPPPGAPGRGQKVK